MWNFLLALGTGASFGKTKAARRFVKPLVTLFLLGALGCAFIYAFIVLKAASERSHPSYVHPHSTH